MSDLVGNPEDRFSRVAAHVHVYMITKTCPCNIQIFWNEKKLKKNSVENI